MLETTLPLVLKHQLETNLASYIRTSVEDNLVSYIRTSVEDNIVSYIRTSVEDNIVSYIRTSVEDNLALEMAFIIDPSGAVRTRFCWCHWLPCFCCGCTGGRSLVGAVSFGVFLPQYWNVSSHTRNYGLDFPFLISVQGILRRCHTGHHTLEEMPHGVPNPRGAATRGTTP
ncbi:hypothetical protein BgiBS90_001091 [Biomphalaria glabrata]|nr:hypothetical protein BgiBS90_001091 [Biomphalaria glabrata]